MLFIGIHLHSHQVLSHEVLSAWDAVFITHFTSASGRNVHSSFLQGESVSHLRVCCALQCCQNSMDKVWEAGTTTTQLCKAPKLWSFAITIGSIYSYGGIGTGGGGGLWGQAFCSSFHPLLFFYWHMQLTLILMRTVVSSPELRAFSPIRRKQTNGSEAVLLSEICILNAYIHTLSHTFKPIL